MGLHKIILIALAVFFSTLGAVGYDTHHPEGDTQGKWYVVMEAIPSSPRSSYTECHCK